MNSINALSSIGVTPVNKDGAKAKSNLKDLNDVNRGQALNMDKKRITTQQPSKQPDKENRVCNRANALFNKHCENQTAEQMMAERKQGELRRRQQAAPFIRMQSSDDETPSSSKELVLMPD